MCVYLLPLVLRNVSLHHQSYQAAAFDEDSNEEEDEEDDIVLQSGMLLPGNRRSRYVLNIGKCKIHKFLNFINAKLHNTWYL